MLVADTMPGAHRSWYTMQESKFKYLLSFNLSVLLLNSRVIAFEEICQFHHGTLNELSQITLLIPVLCLQEQRWAKILVSTPPSDIWMPNSRYFKQLKRSFKKQFLEMKRNRREIKLRRWRLRTFKLLDERRKAVKTCYNWNSTFRSQRNIQAIGKYLFKYKAKGGSQQQVGVCKQVKFRWKKSRHVSLWILGSHSLQI